MKEELNWKMKVLIWIVLILILGTCMSLVDWRRDKLTTDYDECLELNNSHVEIIDDSHNNCCFEKLIRNNDVWEIETKCVGNW